MVSIRNSFNEYSDSLVLSSLSDFEKCNRIDGVVPFRICLMQCPVFLKARI